MNIDVGLWLDHRRAFVVFLEGKETRTKTVESQAEKHAKSTGGTKSSTPYATRGIVAEDRIDRRLRGELEAYYERLAQLIKHAEALYIFGPGEAKEELRKHLESSKRSPAAEVVVETADKLTDGQIIARVRKHYDRIENRRR